MSTLYLKVLFKIKYARRFAMAILTWLLTNATAAFAYFAAPILGIEFDPFLCAACHTTLMYILLFGLIFSAPSIMVIPFIYEFIDLIRIKAYKIIAAISSILLICLFVVSTFIHLFGTDGLDYSTVVTFLLPYAIAAVTSFLLIGKKIIFNGELISNRYKISAR
jgi:hypothetical protein